MATAEQDFLLSRLQDNVKHIKNKIFSLHMPDCKYCDPEYQKARSELENELFFANSDAHPVNPGHMKIIPKRHVDSLCELTDQEVIALRDLLVMVKGHIDQQHHPDGYNIGYNEGPEAGQTVFHLHIHVIPRYKGDVRDPSGGIRTIIPERGNPYKYPK